MCCSVFQFVAVCCNVFQGHRTDRGSGIGALSHSVCVAVCCSMLQFVAVCCGVLQRVAEIEGKFRPKRGGVNCESRD